MKYALNNDNIVELKTILQKGSVVPESVQRTLIIHDTDADGQTAMFLAGYIRSSACNYVHTWPVRHGADAVKIPTEFTEPSSLTHWLEADKGKSNLSLPDRSILDSYDTILVLDHAYQHRVAEYLTGSCGRQVIYVDHHPSDFQSFPMPERCTYIGSEIVNGKMVDSTTGILLKLLARHACDGPLLSGRKGSAISLLGDIADLVDYHDSWKYGRDEEMDKLASYFTTAFYAKPDGLSIQTIIRSAIYIAAPEKFGTPPKDDLTVQIVDDIAALVKGLDAFIDFGKVLRTEKDKLNLNLLERKMVTVKTSGAKIGIVFHSDDYDSLGKAILESGRDVALILSITMREGYMVMQASVRSKDDSPLSAKRLAEAHGGGGHTRSAGFTLTGSAIPTFINHYC